MKRPCINTSHTRDLAIAFGGTVDSRRLERKNLGAHLCEKTPWEPLTHRDDDANFFERPSLSTASSFLFLLARTRSGANAVLGHSLA